MSGVKCAGLSSLSLAVSYTLHSLDTGKPPLIGGSTFNGIPKACLLTIGGSRMPTLRCSPLINSYQCFRSSVLSSLRVLRLLLEDDVILLSLLGATGALLLCHGNQSDLPWSLLCRGRTVGNLRIVWVLCFVRFDPTWRWLQDSV
jgi:hypothetical protein